MKKYFYSLSLLALVAYSCKTQITNTQSTAENTSFAKVEILLKGEALYNQRCGKCHDLPSPSEFTVKEWKPIMLDMAPKSKLTSEETKWVFAYVNDNAKK